jgi:hypothetical protein
MNTDQKIAGLRSRFDKLKNEFDRDLKELEKEQVEKEQVEKENNIDWSERITNKLNNELPTADYICCYNLLKKKTTNGYGYYNKARLKWIIQACADLLNTEKIDWNDTNKLKFCFCYNHDIKIMIDRAFYTENQQNIYFDSKEHIKQAKEILSNLNGVNVLELYYRE